MTNIRLIPTEPCPPEGGRYETHDGRPIRVLAVDIPGCAPIAVARLDEEGYWRAGAWSENSFVAKFRPIIKTRSDLWAVYFGDQLWNTYLKETQAKEKLEYYKKQSINVEIVRYREIKND